MLLVRDEIAILLQDVLDAGEQLVGEKGKTDGLGDVFERDAGLPVELAVGLQGGEDAGGEPVERDVGKDVVDVRVCVGPFEEFLTDPAGVLGGVPVVCGLVNWEERRRRRRHTMQAVLTD